MNNGIASESAMGIVMVVHDGYDRMQGLGLVWGRVAKKTIAAAG